MPSVTWLGTRVATAAAVHAVAVAVALLLALPPSARAGTVTVVPNPDYKHLSRLQYTAAAGERNDVEVAVAPDAVTATITDVTATVTVAGACVLINPHTARCQAAERFWDSGLSLGDGDDVLHVLGPDRWAFPVVARGGSGDDRLVGGSGDDQLDGGGSRDRLSGGAGSDVLTDGDRDASAGRRGPDADVLAGGGGDDTVSYAQRTRPVAVDLRTRGAAGAPGEHDVLRDIESITGGHANDRLIGDETGNGLTGGPGRDRLSGGDGDDGMTVTAGDTVACGGGDETIGGKPTASTFLRPSCEELLFWHRLHRGDVGSARVAVVPHGSTVSRLRYRLGWFDLWSEVTGKVTWREAGGRHRLLGATTLNVDSEAGASLPVRLTALGRQLVVRRHGVRATARLRATILQRRTWTTVMRVPS